MDQKDIDRLLACRAAVDKNREFNKVRVEAYTTCKSVTAAKTLIESKVGATTITADTTKKSADSIKSTLEAERTKMTLAMYDVIREQGFASFGDFKTFNDKANFDTYKECYPVEGKCDWCEQKSFIDQPCLTAPEVYPLYPMEPGKNCKYEMIVNGTWDVDDYVYILFMARLEKRDEKYTEKLDEKMAEYMKDTIIPLSICPVGHGFQINKSKMKPLPFNVFWRA